MGEHGRRYTKRGENEKVGVRKRMGRCEGVGWEEMEEGDKQGMIGCQAADKKRKVNVKPGDHKERTCPLLHLILSVAHSLIPEPTTLFLPLHRCQRCSLSLPERRLFHFPLFLLSRPLPHTLSGSNQTSNYSSAFGRGLCMCM